LSICLGLFRNWFPLIWAHYVEMHKAVCMRPENRHMDILAQGCPFFAMSQNFGPQAVSIRHKDTKNLISGLCLIYVLGLFAHETGGHLVLHEAKILLEAPWGTILAIPSAALTHENLKILEGERRFVFTMYSAGGFFRYRDHDWMTDKAWEQHHGRKPELHQSTWEDGLARFMTISELQASKMT
ncbi:hypothetical protein SISSUDRAFT_990718, partial [Sistotremastrum suecicum HHB10207 ss-3]